MITNWYQKPSFSGRVLNYRSAHPFSHKTGVIFNLVDRPILLPDTKFHKSNLKLVRQSLHNNNYPNNIIQKFVKERYFHCLNKLNDDINLTIQTQNNEIS